MLYAYLILRNSAKRYSSLKLPQIKIIGPITVIMVQQKTPFRAATALKQQTKFTAAYLAVRRVRNPVSGPELPTPSTE